MATRNSYTLEAKLKAVKQLNGECEGNISRASRIQGINRKQLREWSKIETQLANAKHKHVRRQIGAGRKAAYPLLEEQLINWFKDARVSKFIIV